MNDKVEWEVVDTDASEGLRSQHIAPTPQELLKTMLGPWWRWKLAGLFVVGGIVLVFVAAVAGVVVVTAIAFALLAIATVRVRNWLRGSHSLPDRRV